MEDQTVSQATPASGVSSDARTNAVLLWLFAPISSYMMKDNQDPFVKQHARESFYFGIATLALLIGYTIINTCISFVMTPILFRGGFGFGSLITCGLSLVWWVLFLLASVPRLIGVIKANNGELWEIPQITKLLSKYIKF